MEGLALILIGGMLFAHSWYLLGLYTEGRLMGIFVGGLGLAALLTVLLSGKDGAIVPMLLTEAGIDPKAVTPASDIPAVALAVSTMMKTLILAWVVYAVGAAAQGIWDFDDRPIGFYSGFLAVLSAVATIFFFIELSTAGHTFSLYGDSVWLGMSAAVALLTVMGGILFFYMAFPFHNLRPVSGWFILIGGGAVTVIGLLMLTTVIQVT